MFTARYELKIKVYFKLIFVFKGLNRRRKIFPLQAMKVFKGIASISLAPVVLNLDTRWRWVISSTLRPLCLRYPIVSKDVLEKIKKIVPPEIRTRSCPVRNLVDISIRSKDDHKIHTSAFICFETKRRSFKISMCFNP